MNKLDLIVLGIIKEKPRYAGEIITEIKTKKIHKIIDFSLSSVFKKVNNLEERGHIKGYEVKYLDRNSYVRIYEITEKGRRYFDTCIEHETKYEIKICLDINSLLINFDYIDKNKRSKCFKNIRNSINEMKENIDKIFLNKDNNSYSNRIIYSQQEKLIEALEQWLDECEEDMRLGID